MSDNQIRHLTAMIATAICALTFIVGYYAGPRGWWWVVILVVFIYLGIYKIIDK